MPLTKKKKKVEAMSYRAHVQFYPSGAETQASKDGTKKILKMLNRKGHLM